jgi:hypothetical protein
MKTFIWGVIFGVIVSTVGFSGLAKMLDNCLVLVKNQSETLSK